MTAERLQDPTTLTPRRVGAGGIPTESTRIDEPHFSWAVRFVAIGGVIALCCALVLWRLWNSFYYGDDDLLQFHVADQSGFSRELLTLNVFGHFGPVDRLGHLFLLQFGLNPIVGAMIATVLIGLLLVAISTLTRELGLSLVRRLIIVAAAGGSLAYLSAGRWADGTFHLFPALAVTYAVIALHVRGLRTGQRRWHVISVLAFPLGLLTQERAAFALPLIVLVDVFLVWKAESVRQRVRNLWTVRWPLAGMAAIGLSCAYVIQRNYATAAIWPAPEVVGRTLLLAFTNYQFPQLIGLQPTSQLSTDTQLVVLSLIAVSCAALVALNRRNSGPVLFLLATFTLYWSFLLFSPILLPETIVSNAESLGYAAYLTVPALIALGSLEGQPRWSATVIAWRRRQPVAWLAAGWVTALLVASILSLAGAALADRDWGLYRRANAFFVGARASQPQWADPSVTVLPLRAPPGVAAEGGWSFSYAEHLFLLPLLSPGWQLRDLTDTTVVMNTVGQVVPAVLESVATVTPSSPATLRCNTPADPGDGVQIATTPVSGSGPLFARITYRSDADGSLRAIGFDGETYHVGGWAQPVTTGTHTTVVPLPSGTVDAVRFFGLPAGSTLCVSSLDVVRPLLVTGDGGCTSINDYAEPIAPVNCPDELR